MENRNPLHNFPAEELGDSLEAAAKRLLAFETALGTTFTEKQLGEQIRRLMDTYKKGHTCNSGVCVVCGEKQQILVGPAAGVKREVK